MLEKSYEETVNTHLAGLLLMQKEPLGRLSMFFI